MKYRLPILPVVFVLAASLPIPPTRPAHGQNLVADAARELLRHTSLEARIRQQVDLFGQHLVGAGAYRQLGSGPDKLLHLDLKLQTASQTASLLQIGDGRFLWTRRETLDGATLERVDLERVRRALRTESPPAVVDPTAAWMAMGGLAKLLHGLDQNFDFAPPQAASIGQLPVWMLQGHWKKEKLARLLPEQKADILAGKAAQLDSLPAHLPDRVALVLGRDDVIPLFPYRIEFWRGAAAGATRRTNAARASEGPDTDHNAIVTIELFEVRTDTRLDPQQFVYEPGDQEVTDQTDLLLERLGLRAAPRGGGESD